MPFYRVPKILGNTYTIEAQKRSLNNSFMRLSFIILTLIYVFISGLVSGAEIDSLNFKPNSTLSLKFHNEPLGSVCEKISQKTGYTIQIDENWSDILITANIENDSVISALNKALKLYNHSLLINEKDKIILVFFLSDRKLTAKSNSIDAYAEEYIKSLPIDVPNPIVADSMDTYAQEYMKHIERTEAVPTEYGSIDTYAEEYVKRITQSPDFQPPIIANDINEYAKEYIRNQSKK
jgi:hypothetical protein